MPLDLILSGAVYGLLLGCLMAYVLEERYRYFSEQVYQAKTQRAQGASETQLSGWIEALEEEVNAELTPVSTAADSTIEDLVQEAQQQASYSRNSFTQTRI